MLPFFMCLQTLTQDFIAIGSILVIHFIILETSMTLSILVFWYPKIWIYLTSKYLCECTNTQYSEVKPAADAYVTLLYGFKKNVRRVARHLDPFMLSYLIYWKSLALYIYLYFGTSSYGYIGLQNIVVNLQICNTM